MHNGDAIDFYTPAVQTLQRITRHFQERHPALDIESSREKYLRYALQLFVFLGTRWTWRSVPLVKGKGCLAVAQTLVALPLGDLISNSDLRPLSVVLGHILPYLSNVDRWYLVTHPNVVPIIVRIIEWGSASNPGLYKFLHLEDSYSQHFDVGLRTLSRVAELFDRDPEAEPRSWPGTLGSDLGCAVIRAIAAKIRQGGPTLQDEISSHLPLLHWLGESIVRDSSIGRRCYDAGVRELFEWAVQQFDRAESEGVRLQIQIRKRYEWGLRVAILFLALAYFGAHSAAVQEPNPNTSRAEFDSVVNFVTTFIHSLERSEVAIDSAELVIRQTLAFAEYGYKAEPRKAFGTGLDVACEQMDSRLQEIGCRGTFAEEMDRCLAAMKRSSFGLIRHYASTSEGRVGRLEPICRLKDRIGPWSV